MKKKVYVIVIKLEHSNRVDTYGFPAARQRALFIKDIQSEGCELNYATSELKVSEREFKKMFKGVLKRGSK